MLITEKHLNKNNHSGISKCKVIRLDAFIHIYINLVLTYTFLPLTDLNIFVLIKSVEKCVLNICIIRN